MVFLNTSGKDWQLAAIQKISFTNFLSVGKLSPKKSPEKSLQQYSVVYTRLQLLASDSTLPIKLWANSEFS